MRIPFLTAAVALIALACCLLSPTPARAQAPAAKPNADKMGIRADLPDDATIDTIVEHAPKPTRYLDPRLEARLVDYIDCAADPDTDPHPFLADTHHRVTQGRMGRYRETGTHANSWFAYRFRTAGPQKPHLIIVEYPDDDYRTACVFLHETWHKGAFNSDFHVEGGYWTGRELPVSHRAEALELWLWPKEDWPGVVVMNHTDSQRAAASRIWVYEVTGGLPPAGVNEPQGDLPRRQLGAFFEDTRMYRFNFGTYSAAGARRLVDYIKYAGHNVLAFDVVLYAWNKSLVPAFEGNPGEDASTRQALEACDAAGVDFIAVFDPTKQYKIKGLPTADLTDDAVIDAWVEGIGQFVDKYGSHPSLKGISFGGPAGCNRFMSPKITRLQDKLHAMLQAKRPDITLHVFFGYQFLHRSMFNVEGFRPYNAVIKPWEAATEAASFDDQLAATVDRYFRRRLHMNIEEYRNKPGLVVHRSFYPNDARCFEHYPLRTPRYMVYRDYDRSQQISDALANDGREGACLFGTYFEMVIPLWPRNFWSRRIWIGPQVIAGGDHALAAYTEPLYQRDYPLMIHGSWNEPLVGAASRYRSFAEAYRTLPALPFETITRGNYVAVRRLAHQGATWLYALNNHGSPARVELQFASDNVLAATDLVANRRVDIAEGKLSFELPPYGLRTFKLPAADVAIRGTTVQRRAEAYDHVRQRVRQFEARLIGLRKAGVQVSPKFDAALDAAREHVKASRFDAADRALPETLGQELDLRLWMTRDRPRLVARRAERVFTIDGRLDDWRDARPAARLDSADHLTNFHHSGHQWSGPADLGATVYAAYDNANLVLAIRVTDDAVHEQDALTLKFPPNYDSLAEGERAPGGRTFKIAAPVDANTPTEQRGRGAHLVARRTGDGYVVEATVPLSLLGLPPGETTGLHVVVEEIDFPDEPLPKFHWTRTQSMEWPVNPWWTWWRDAQSAGELHLAK